jgi:hypothetical protein
VTPTQQAILSGATSPIPDGGAGTVRYSTAEKAEVMWTGSSWELLTSMPGDAQYHNVVALVYGKGANNATADTDRSKSGAAVTFHSNAKITTTNPPPGSTSSMVFNGGTDRVEIAQATSGLLQPVQGALWALDMFVRLEGGSRDNNVLFSLASSSTNGLQIHMGTDGIGSYSLEYDSVNSYATADMSYLLNKWAKVTILMGEFGLRYTLRTTDYEHVGVINLEPFYAAHTEPLVIGGTKHGSKQGFVGKIAGVRVTRGFRGMLYETGISGGVSSATSTVPDEFLLDYQFPPDRPASYGRNGELVGTTLAVDTRRGFANSETALLDRIVLLERNGAVYGSDGYWLSAAAFPLAAAQAQLKSTIRTHASVANLTPSVWTDISRASPHQWDVITKCSKRHGLVGLVGVSRERALIESNGGQFQTVRTAFADYPFSITNVSGNTNVEWKFSNYTGGTVSAIAVIETDAVYTAEQVFDVVTTAASNRWFQYNPPGAITAYCLGPNNKRSWAGTAVGTMLCVATQTFLAAPSAAAGVAVVAIRWDKYTDNGAGAFYILWANGVLRRILAYATVYDPTFNVNLGAVQAGTYADLAINQHTQGWQQKAIALTTAGVCVYAIDTTLANWTAAAIPDAIGSGWSRVVYPDTGMKNVIFNHDRISDGTCYMFRFGASPQLAPIYGYLSSPEPAVSFSALESGAVVNPKNIILGPGIIVQSEVSGRVYSAEFATSTEEYMFQMQTLNNVWDRDEVLYGLNNLYTPSYDDDIPMRRLN